MVEYKNGLVQVLFFFLSPVLNDVLLLKSPTTCFCTALALLLLFFFISV